MMSRCAVTRFVHCTLPSTFRPSLNKPLKRTLTTLHISSTTQCYTQLTPLRFKPHKQQVRFITEVKLPEPRERIPITFIDQQGRQYKVNAAVGDTLLQVAQEFELPMPYLAQCNGGGVGWNKFDCQATCLWCHVYIDNKNVALLPEKSQFEDYMTYWIPNATENTRFSCEVYVTKEMAGMTVVIPDYGDGQEDWSRNVTWPS